MSFEEMETMADAVSSIVETSMQESSVSGDSCPSWVTNVHCDEWEEWHEWEEYKDSN